jgi:outer membrane immunogenic protein
MRLLLIAAALVALLTAPARAADLPLKAPLLPPVVPYNWTGFYAGGNIGYSFGDANNIWTLFAAGANLAATSGVCRPAGSALCATGGDSNRLNGVVGGIEAGYNWQIVNYLLGVEADFQGSGQRGSGSPALTFPLNGTPGGTITTAYSESLAWFGTVRARAGYVIAGRWLLYGTGGLAYGGVTSSGSASSAGIAGVPAVVALGAGACSVPVGAAICPVANWSDSAVHVGWALGAGAEGAIFGNWTWRVEYLHIDLGNANLGFGTLPGCFGTGVACGPVAAGTGNINSHITDDIVRAGFTYRFGVL